MKILDLVLKGKWYDMIANGAKKEEYREITEYWICRIIKCHKWCGCGIYSKKEILSHCLQRKCENIIDFTKISEGYTHIRFHRGYTNVTMIFAFKKITVAMGNPKWGAPTDREVFIIKLGERL